MGVRTGGRSRLEGRTALGHLVMLPGCGHPWYLCSCLAAPGPGKLGILGRIGQGPSWKGGLQ